MFIKIAVISAYVLMIVVIGVLRGKKTTSFKEFFLGGGNVGPWMTAFTYGATYFSAVVFIGFAGKVGWQFGYSGLWIAVGNSFLGVLAVWWLLGGRIKKMSQDYQVATMAEFFEKRYQSKFLKIFSSASIFVFFIPYSAAVFIGLSYLFKLNFNTEYWQALVFMGLFTAVYMVLGGYNSMSMIDVIFSALMIFGSGVVIVSVLGRAGGLAAATARLAAVDPKLTSVVGPPGIWPLFCLVFLTSVAPFAMPQPWSPAPCCSCSPASSPPGLFQTPPGVLFRAGRGLRGLQIARRPEHPGHSRAENRPRLRLHADPAGPGDAGLPGGRHAAGAPRRQPRVRAAGGMGVHGRGGRLDHGQGLSPADAARRPGEGRAGRGDSVDFAADADDSSLHVLSRRPASSCWRRSGARPRSAITT